MLQKKGVFEGILEGLGYRKGRPVGTFPIIDRGAVACVAMKPFMSLKDGHRESSITPFESTWSRFSAALSEEQKRRVQSGIST